MSQAKHIIAGENLRLLCNATVRKDTKLELTWEFPSQSTIRRATYTTRSYDRLNVYYRYKSRHTLFVSTLIIQNVDRSLDTGTYRCIAEVADNREKRSFAEVKIEPYSAGLESHIKMIPEIVSRVVQVHIHQTAVLAVYVDARNTVKFTWKRNGIPILADTPRYIMDSMVEGYERLLIQGALGSDQGNFTLEAVLGDTRSEVNITLFVIEPPAVSLKSPGRFYMVGRPAIFSCTVRAFPMPRIVWKFQPCDRYCAEERWEESNFFWKTQPAENISTTTNLSARVSTSNFHATISELGSGYIRCETNSSNLGENQHSRSSHATIRVLVTDFENGFKAEMMPHIPVKLQKIVMTCVVNNYEFSDVQWEVLSPGESDYRPVATSQSVIAQSADISIFSDSHTLTIMRADGRNSGQYRCAARRRSGETPLQSQVFDLRSLHPYTSTALSFVDGNNGIEKMNVKFEGKMDLECRGLSPPQFEWTKDGRPVVESQMVRIENGGSRLVNHKVTPETGGQYTCRAYHAKSSVSKSWKVDVEGDSTTRRGTMIIASVVTVLTVLLCIFVFIIWLVLIIWRKYCKEGARRKDLEHMENLVDNDKANSALIEPTAPMTEHVALLNYDRRWEVPRENLKIHSEWSSSDNTVLGSGHFGKVMTGEAKDLRANPGEVVVVAVKMLKEKAAIVQRKALLDEIKVMMHIGQHLNVVNLLGACTRAIDNGELFMIMEFCQNGSLLTFLQNHAGDRFYNQLDIATMKIKPPRDDQLDEIAQTKLRLEKSDSRFDGKILTTRDLVSYSFQVSNGMDYLAKHKVIHRDLAARNVLVAENDVVKICDFGLAREDYIYVKKSQGVIPVKWVAIESICDNVFTTESDVWAFGILMWEIFSLGSAPYPGHEANSTFVEQVRKGLRMDHPYLAPREIYNMMCHCWEARPGARPSFSTLSALLGNLLHPSVVQRYLDMNIPFEHLYETIMYSDNAGYINDPVDRNSLRGYGMPTDGTGNTIDALETQPMLTSDGSKPSRSGNEVDNGDLVNPNLSTPKRNTTAATFEVDDANGTAMAMKTAMPGDIVANRGRRYANAGDARTNSLYGANPTAFSKTVEI